jgi:hypothetical protein
LRTLQSSETHKKDFSLGLLEKKITINIVLQILIGFICDSRILQKFGMSLSTICANFIYTPRKECTI